MSFSKEEIDEIMKADLSITPYGIVLTEQDYEKYIKGNEGRMPESRPLSNDYILVKHTGTINFIHYSPIPNLTEIKPSIFEDNMNLSFGSGIYCFNADYHHTIGYGQYVYIGFYNGDYLECMYDCDPSEEYDKGDGNTKEYLLLTDKPVTVRRLVFGGPIPTKQVLF